MYRNRHRPVRGILLLLCLIGLEARPASAQEQQPDRNEKAGNISFERPFEPVADAGNVALPASTSDETLPELGGLQRLPPVDQPKSESTGFGFGPGMPGMGPGGQGPISYRTFWCPSVPVKGQAGDW